MKRKSVIDMDRLVLAIDNWGLALVNEMQLLREAIVAINIDRKTEPLPKTINGVRIADAVAWADKWLENNPISEMWDMIRTLRDATEWQDEPQTEERTTQGTGDCEHCSRLFVDCDGR